MPNDVGTKLDPVQKELKLLNEALRTVRDEHAFLMEREEKHRHGKYLGRGGGGGEATFLFWCFPLPFPFPSLLSPPPPPQLTLSFHTILVALNTNKRVMWWFLMQIIMLGAVCYWQIRSLKSFFETRRLV